MPGTLMRARRVLLLNNTAVSERRERRRRRMRGIEKKEEEQRGGFMTEECETTVCKLRQARVLFSRIQRYASIFHVNMMTNYSQQHTQNQKE